MASDLNNHGFSGISGFAADVLEAMGAPGIGLLVFIESVFPPIPSEVILPFAGYLSQSGNLSLVAMLMWSTVGAWLGALVFYAIGRCIGLERTVAMLVWTRIVSRRDAERGAHWFTRFGTWSVFIGRMIPGVRSVISLPAGAAAMNLVVFSVLSATGSFLWNALLLGIGAALGTQHGQFEQYLGYFDIVVYAGAATVLITLIVRSYRHRKADRVAAGVD
ncbi:DedA family protein [Williamsia sp. CHRR-6]|uniref:DedA family protein n=1 Tax=Williamsia sp. CHRR-6 TaxID=2835871 RepID=UPI001BDA2308|nr:DedA family protein [Williamsia sp. CHRR-6]MBT0568671.1 DedA family protein [Williamsia sp. CHRR-6]